MPHKSKTFNIDMKTKNGIFMKRFFFYYLSLSFKMTYTVNKYGWNWIVFFEDVVVFIEVSAEAAVLLTKSSKGRL